jgi:TnpA family transposase
MISQSKRQTITSLPEVQELYSVPTLNGYEREYFFTLTDDELAMVNRLDHYRNRIHLILILGYFKVKRVCLVYRWKDIKDDYQYVAERYFPKANKQNKNITRQTRSRLYSKVFEILDYQRCDKETEFELLFQLERRAKYYIDESKLFHDAIAFLKLKQVAVPRYSTLQRIISKANNTEESRLSLLIEKYLTHKEPFLRLIDHAEKQHRLNDLKKQPKAHKSGENKREITRHQTLAELSDAAFQIIKKLKLTDGNIRYFASRCMKYNIRDLRELKTEKALIYLVCFVATRFRISNDILTLSFLVAYKELDDKAKLYRDECATQQALVLAESIAQVPDLLTLFVDDSIKNSVDFGTVRNTAFNIVSKDRIPLVCQKMTSVKPDKAIFKWEYIDTHFRQVIDNLRPLFLVLDFGCRNNTVLHRQMSLVKAALGAKILNPTIDGRVIKSHEKKYLKEDLADAQHHKTLMAHRHEMYLYKLLDQGIRNGDIFVKNSLEYLSFDDYLVDDKIWKKRNSYLLDVGLEWMNDATQDHLKSLETLFKEKIQRVSERISEGSNAYIRRKPNVDKLLWSRAVIAKDDSLTEKFFAHFDRKTIVHVLRKVNAETGFLEHLKSKAKPHKKLTVSIENLLACLIANGTFQGTYKFSALSDQQYKVLKRIEDEYFQKDALRQAMDIITSSAVQLSAFDDFKLSDGKVHSSADGQRFESKHGNPLVDYSAKYYGKKKGAVVYMLAASHFVLQSKVISARSHESHHLFDLAYNNTSDLKATIVSTDTHGINQFNHCILNAFGYQFTPRYAKFKHRFLSEFNVKFNDGVELSLATPINWKLIRSEWENITKILLSLGLRTVQQSTLVKKLCGFKKHSVTMRALAEYNRVFKCLHLLDYADNKQLRQVIQESLNRGEQLQGLKRALAALGGNQFRGRHPDEMALWNSCADLLANSIVYYNAMIMSSFKTYCLETGNSGQLKYLRSVSPASWEHLLLNGFYDLADNDEHWNIDVEIKGLKLAA